MDIEEFLIALIVCAGIVAYVLHLVGRVWRRLRRATGKWIPKFESTRSDYVVTGTNEFGNPIFEHREIAQQVLGRKLRHYEVVHHINGRKNDNRISNLCVMGREEHDRYHSWYDWVVATYQKHPRLETSLRKLEQDFGGIILDRKNAGRRKPRW